MAPPDAGGATSAEAIVTVWTPMTRKHNDARQGTRHVVGGCMVLLALSGCATGGGPATDPAVTSPGDDTLSKSAPARMVLPVTGAATSPAAPVTAGTARAPVAAENAATSWVAGRRHGDAASIIAVALPAAAAVAGSAARSHLHVEGIDWPGPHAAVVTVLALDPRATSVAVRRIAVPIALVDRVPVLAGPALLLPGAVDAPSTAAPLAASPVDDARTWHLAEDALIAAGWAEVRIRRLEQAIEAWPTIAHFTALDGDGTVQPFVVWLRRSGAVLVVAGLPSPTSGSTPARSAPTGGRSTDRPTAEEPRP